MDVDSDIPDSVRRWHPSVRRPTNPPLPSTYHQAIDPWFIFEIDADAVKPGRRRHTGAHARSILVVPSRCCYCRSIHQACSRSLPSCARCTQAGRECVPLVMDGYDTLPGPKTGATLTPSTGFGNHNPTRGPRQPPVQAQSQSSDVQNGSDTQGNENGERSLPTTSATTKRRLLANQDGETLHKRRKRLPESALVTEDVEMEPTPAPLVTNPSSTSKLTRSAQQPSNKRQRISKFTAAQPEPPLDAPTLEWSFVKPSRDSSKSVGVTQSLRATPTLTHVPPNSPHPSTSPALLPRAWTKTLTHLLSLFPGLGKTQSGLTWEDCATPIILLGDAKGANHGDTWVDRLSLNLSMTWKFVYQPRPGFSSPPPPLSVPSSVDTVQPDVTEDSISSSIQTTHSGTQPHTDDAQRRRGDLNSPRAKRQRTSPSSSRKEAPNVTRESSSHSDSRVSPAPSSVSKADNPLKKLGRIPRIRKGVDHSQGGDPAPHSVPPSSSNETQAPQQPRIPRVGTMNHTRDDVHSRPQCVNSFTDGDYQWRKWKGYHGLDGENCALPSASAWNAGSRFWRANARAPSPFPTWEHFPTDYTQLDYSDDLATDAPSWVGSSNPWNNVNNMRACEVTQLTSSRESNMQVSVEVESNGHKSEVGPVDMAGVHAPAPVLVPTSIPAQACPRVVPEAPVYDKELKHEDDTTKYTSDTDTLILPKESSNNVEDTPAAMNIDDSSAPPTPKTGRDLESIPELAPVRHTRPSDIDILFGAQSHYIPVLIWAHRESPLCPATPSPENVYACLGYFFVTSIQEEVVEWTRDPRTSKLWGSVQWRFNLGWAPGGEEFLLDNHIHEGTSPRSTPHEFESAPVALPDIMRPWWRSSESPSIGYHIQNLRLRYYSYLPYDILGPFHPNECSFSRGWFCRRCGLANAPLFLRHWQCQSEICMTKEAFPLGKVVPLLSVRDPHARLPVPLPLNHVPHCLDVKKETWENGMLSYTYVLRENVQAVYMFTANREELQQEATTFREDVQRDVILRRESTATPFFTYLTMTSSWGRSTDLHGSIMLTDVPDCIVRARNHLLQITEKYGMAIRPRFDRLSVVGWYTSGRRKWPNVLGAKEGPVTVLCLGADVVLHLSPRGGYHNSVPDAPGDTGPEARHEAEPNQVLGSNASSQGRVDQDNFKHSASAFGGGTIDVVGRGGDKASRQVAVGAADNSDPATSLVVTMESVGSASTAPIKPKDKGKGKQRKGKKAGPSVPPFSIVLMHGDSVILTGDDYECLFERKGTTMLIIGSAEDVVKVI